MLELELAERPEHPFTLFNLGMTHVHGSRFAEAVDYLRRGIARSGPGESHLRKAFALLVYAEMRLGRHDEALEPAGEGGRCSRATRSCGFARGSCCTSWAGWTRRGKPTLDVLENRRRAALLQRGPSALTGFKARQNLAVVATDMGDLAEAERQWREVVREVPGIGRAGAGWARRCCEEADSPKLESLAEGS